MSMNGFNSTIGLVFWLFRLVGQLPSKIQLFTTSLYVYLISTEMVNEILYYSLKHHFLPIKPCVAGLQFSGGALGNRLRLAFI